MKIGTFVRTFQDFEEIHIERFMATHAFSDVICVGLCETSLKTIEIASRYPNVKFKVFNGLEMFPDGSLGAHESKYYAFLNDWANEEDVDWIIFDDADHAPNTTLQLDARTLLESTNAPFAYNQLLYVWGTDHYFPELNNCKPSERLWAWNKHKWTPDISREHPYTVEIKNQPDAQIDNALVMPHPPYCVLHYSFLTEEVTRQKMAFNAKRGVAQAYPPDSCGRIERLPEWANQ